MKHIKKLKELKKWLRVRGFMRESSEVSRMYKSAVSKKHIKDLKDWLDGTTDSKLSFNDLFEESFRIAIPFNTKEKKALIKIISLLRDEGWMPAGKGGYFDTKMVDQKMRHLGGEEFSEEVEVADLKVAKEIVKTIPVGPRKGEEVVQRKVLSLAKALGGKISEGQLEWWLKTQTEYVKDYNWKQLEAIFHKQADAEGLSIIVSRDPIDVLRMSDHEGITSCHSQGNSYFECAVAESRGTGLVAYLVDNKELNKLFRTSQSEDFGAGQRLTVTDPDIPGPVTIDSFDGKEIFEDRDRSVSGIKPRSRVRLRKYVYNEGEYEFAAPENRTYGPHPPGFVGAVREWAWESQKFLWPQEHGELTDSGWYSEEGYGMPEEHRLQMHGGSYRDTSDGSILNAFFAEGEFVTNYSGNVETVSENEEDTLTMWENEVEEVLARAQAELKHTSFHAEVSDDGDNNPYVWAMVSMYVQIPFSEGEFEFPEKPNSWEEREFADLFEHPEGGEVEEISINHESEEITFSVSLNCEDCNNPDDVSNHFDYILKDIDGNYFKYTEGVRRRLVEAGYIAEIEFDKLDKRLNAYSLRNFNVYGSDVDEDGEILISTKTEAFPTLEVPKEFINTAGDNVSKEDINLLLQSKPHDSTWHKYILDDSYKKIFIKHLNKINETPDSQLYFDFGDGWTPPGQYPEKYGPGQYNFAPLLSSLEFSASVPGRSITLGLSMTLKVSDSKEDLLHAERFLNNLDREFERIVPEVLEAVKKNIDEAVQNKRIQIKEFSEGFLAKPVISELKKSGQPDVIRLALWVESNWDSFNDAEKEVAYYSFLLPAQRDGDYIHKDELDTPKFWDNIMQKRHDTEFNYRWKGLSMKDVMPYTDPSAEPGKDPNYGSEGKWVGESGRISPPTVAELERMFIK